MENELIALEQINPVQFFTSGQMDPVLSEIEKKAFEIAEKGNLETATGRKVYSSAAYKVSQSKTLLDNFGKDLVSDWKKKSKVVDSSRKKIRDYLDELKERVRQPLTEWEQAEEEKKLQEKIEKDWDEALVEHDLWTRQKAIER